jgi:hypothetical protein
VTECHGGVEPTAWGTGHHWADVARDERRGRRHRAPGQRSAEPDGLAAVERVPLAESRVAAHTRLDNANQRMRPACRATVARFCAGFSMDRAPLDGAILGELSTKERRREVRKRLPMRSQKQPPANFAGGFGKQRPRGVISGVAAFLALECGGFGAWRGRGALGRRSSRECCGREGARAGGVLDAGRALSAGQRGERRPERLTAGAVLGGRVGFCLTGHRRARVRLGFSAPTARRGTSAKNRMSAPQRVQPARTIKT